MAAKAAGVAAIDCAFAGLHDSARLKAECETALRDGFAGKLALDPNQAAIIASAFV
jgi:citrate lyase subunit beta / citryl-CoA lyase